MSEITLAASGLIPSISRETKLDATDTQVTRDQPGNHDVGFYGPAGLFIKVRYGGNLVVSGCTGCRLPHDKK